MIKTLRTGADPNSAVANAMQAAKLASANRWKRNQSIPPPPLPSRPSSSAHVDSTTKKKPSNSNTISTKKRTAATLANIGLAHSGVENAKRHREAAASGHRATTAISGQMPNWTHIHGVPVKAVSKKVPTMDHTSQSEIRQAENDTSNITGVTSANHASALVRYGMSHPNTEREKNKSNFEKSSPGMPPHMKIPYKRGRTLRVPEAKQRQAPTQPQTNEEIMSQRKQYYKGLNRPAGLSPREAYVGRFHRDVHDGEKMPPYDPSGDTNRDMSTISENAPDFMHIPGIPFVKATYRKGVGGAEVVQHTSKAGSAWLRYDHNDNDHRAQHPHDITVNSEAAPHWMHSPRQNMKYLKPKTWRKPEPQTVAHNIQCKNARSNPGEKGHNYHYLRPPHKQIVPYYTRGHGATTRDEKTSFFHHVPHSSAVSVYAPEFLRVRGVPLTKFKVPDGPQATEGNILRSLRPQTGNSPRTPLASVANRSERLGAVSFDAPEFMRIPGIVVARGPFENMDRIIIGSDRQPVMSPKDKKIIENKRLLGKTKNRINPQHRQSNVLGRRPSNADGSPIVNEKADQILVPRRPSTVGMRSDDGRDGIFLGSRRSRSRRAQAKLVTPYAINFPLNENAPIPFWDKVRLQRNKETAAAEKKMAGTKSKTVDQSKKNADIRAAATTVVTMNK